MCFAFCNMGYNNNKIINYFIIIIEPSQWPKSFAMYSEQWTLFPHAINKRIVIFCGVGLFCCKNEVLWSCIQDGPVHTLKKCTNNTISVENLIWHTECQITSNAPFLHNALKTNMLQRCQMSNVKCNVFSYCYMT